jgi:hypothetical protein
MTDGFKLSELADLGVALASTDRLYVVRGTTSYHITGAELRIDADQIRDAGVFGLTLLATANVGAARTALGLGSLAQESTVGTAEIDNEAVTLAKMADLTDGDLIIGDGTDRPSALSTTALGRSLLVASPETDVPDAADDESAAYTGQDNAQVGSVYAKSVDLNALRVGYEDLRGVVNDALAVLRAQGLMA